MDLAEVKGIIEQHLSNTDLYLVEAKIEAGNRIVVEIDSDNAVSIDDCVALNKYIEAQLDREVEDYELEVGSAGITSPFKLLRQYQKNIGNEVEVLLKSGKKSTGILQEANEETFVLTVSGQEKPEGSKRKITVEENLTTNYSDVKYIKNVIKL
ncbi:ribosome maturation factor RimP [Bacteroidia bacterium]|nr:ribosome maturation factor RimP [Bacteroidia bacterium]